MAELLEMLPDWLDCALWHEFEQHRKEIRAKLTPTATKRMWKHLDDYRKMGVNPNEALELSIRNQWRGVFPERLVEKTNGTVKPQSDAEWYALARERNVPTRPGESWPDFRHRIMKAVPL